MKVVAIVQARMGSTRLPGKVLADVAGRPILERVVKRVSRAGSIDEVCVATTRSPDDDVVADLAPRIGATAFRGSADDVLSRYAGAAAATAADVCVRVTADCPLIDPGVIDRVVGVFLDSRDPVDYVSNTQARTFPRGLDVEVFGVGALTRAAAEATLPFERAHVTAFMYRNPAAFRILQVEQAEDRSAWRWTVDEPADLEFVRAVYAALGPDDDFGFDEVEALLLERPELARINDHVRQKALEEG